MSENKEQVAVSIGGNEYQIKLGDQNAKYIEELAKIVDDEINDIKTKANNSLSYSTTLALTALNLADKLKQNGNKGTGSGFDSATLDRLESRLTRLLDSL